MRKILAAITVLFGLCGLASAQPAGMVFGPGTTPCAYTTCKATSLALGGAAIGTDALGVTGTSTLGGAVTVSSGNLSVPSGGVTANSFTASSTGLFVFGSRGILSSSAAGTLQFGNADVDTNASIVAQTIRSQGALAGGTADQAGKNWTFIASPGKGTGAGGSFIFQTTPAGSSGTVVGTPTTALTIDSTQAATFAGTIASIITNFSNRLAGNNAAGPQIFNVAASSTVPTLIPNKADTTTGIGAQASGNMSMIVGGAEQGRWTSTGLNNTNIGATTAGTGAFTNVGIGLAINTGFALTSSIATGKTSYSSVVGSAGNWQMGQNAGACGGDDTFGWYSSTAVKYLLCLNSSGPLVTINAPLNIVSLTQTSVAQSGTMCYNSGTSAVTYDATLGCLTSLEETKNIQPGGIPTALPEIMALKPFWFSWKDKPLRRPDNSYQPGLGAHATEKVDARLVGYGPDGKLRGVRYAEMVALLVAGMQQQQTEITALQKQVATLKGIPANDNVWAHLKRAVGL